MELTASKNLTSVYKNYDESIFYKVEFSLIPLKGDNANWFLKFRAKQNLPTDTVLKIYKRDVKSWSIQLFCERNMNESLSSGGVSGKITFENNGNSSYENYVWVAEIYMGQDQELRALLYTPGANGLLNQLNVKTFPFGNNPMDAFVEQQNDLYKTRKNNGICFSGGGTRAMILAMGQMQGLDSLDLLNTSKYISSVSGGSWASTLYSFDEANSSALLGTPVKPSNISENNLPEMATGAQTHRFLGILLINAVRVGLYYRSELPTNDKLNNFFEQLKQFGITPELSPDNLWIESVRINYLTHISETLQAQKTYMTLDESTKADIISRNSVLSTYNFKTLRNRENGTVPYPIVNTVLMFPSLDNPIVGKFNYSGFENTPLYVGAVNDINNEITYNQTPYKIGGGYMEPIGYNTVFTKVNEDIDEVFQLFDKMNPSTASGISSSAAAGFTSKISGEISWYNVLKTIRQIGITTVIAGLEQAFGITISAEIKTAIVNYIEEQIDEPKPDDPAALFLDPQANYFPILNDNDTPQNIQFTLGDGGLIENFGIMPLLRRKVEKIVVFINTATPLDIKYTFDPSNEADFDSSKIDSAFTSLFGFYNASVGDKASGVDYSQNQVFDNKLLTELVKTLQEQKENGKTLIAETPGISVMSNKTWNLIQDDDYKVDVLWVYNDEVSDFNDSFEKSPAYNEFVKAEKEGNDHTLLKIGNLPMYNTFGSTIRGLQNIQLNALAGIGAWNVTQNSTLFEKYLG